MISVDVFVAIVVAVIVIAVASALASRIGVAGPLVLVAVGVAISLWPSTPSITVPPELILVGVLPPLLYAAAASAPAIEFRRDLRAIGNLAVLLVIVSSVLLGVFFAWAIPGLGLPLAIALGAILSPTDAVATTIVRRVGVPRRVVTLLEGESLLNDASALVIVRTAVAAVAAGFSVLTTLGAFAWSVVSAVVVGAVVGALALRVRRWLHNATAGAALGFTIPYVAYLPTDALGGSGLVAAVVAGVVCGQGAATWLTPEQRIADKLNWRSVEFLLEGAVFLLMGLELSDIVGREATHRGGVWTGLWIAGLAFVLILAIRAAFVLPIMRYHSVRVVKAVKRRIAASDAAVSPKRLRRIHADVDYFEASPLTWRHSVVIVWAGMRGVVTLAAAQTLPENTPERDLLVFIAFLVAAGSLLVQGLTLPVVARWVGLKSEGAGGPPWEEIASLDAQLRTAAQRAVAKRSLRRDDGGTFAAEDYALDRATLAPMILPDGDGDRAGDEFDLAVIDVMRTRLRELARTGAYSTVAVHYVLDELDAAELSVKLHLESEN